MKESSGFGSLTRRGYHDNRGRGGRGRNGYHGQDTFCDNRETSYESQAQTLAAPNGSFGRHLLPPRPPPGPFPSRVGGSYNGSGFWVPPPADAKDAAAMLPSHSQNMYAGYPANLVQPSNLLHNPFIATTATDTVASTAHPMAFSKPHNVIGESNATASNMDMVRARVLPKIDCSSEHAAPDAGAIDSFLRRPTESDTYNSMSAPPSAHADKSPSFPPEGRLEPVDEPCKASQATMDRLDEIALARLQDMDKTHILRFQRTMAEALRLYQAQHDSSEEQRYQILSTLSQARGAERSHDKNVRLMYDRFTYELKQAFKNTGEEKEAAQVRAMAALKLSTNESESSRKHREVIDRCRSHLNELDNERILSIGAFAETVHRVVTSAMGPELIDTDAITVSTKITEGQPTPTSSNMADFVPGGGDCYLASFLKSPAPDSSGQSQPDTAILKATAHTSEQTGAGSKSGVKNARAGQVQGTATVGVEPVISQTLHKFLSMPPVEPDINPLEKSQKQVAQLEEENSAGSDVAKQALFDEPITSHDALMQQSRKDSAIPSNHQDNPTKANKGKGKAPQDSTITKPVAENEPTAQATSQRDDPAAMSNESVAAKAQPDSLTTEQAPKRKKNHKKKGGNKGGNKGNDDKGPGGVGASSGTSTAPSSTPSVAERLKSD